MLDYARPEDFFSEGDDYEGVHIPPCVCHYVWPKQNGCQSACRIVGDGLRGVGDALFLILGTSATIMRRYRRIRRDREEHIGRGSCDRCKDSAV